MRIRWTPAAASDLQNVNDYLNDHHPQYRQPMIRKLYEVIQWPVYPINSRRV